MHRIGVFTLLLASFALTGCSTGKKEPHTSEPGAQQNAGRPGQPASRPATRPEGPGRQPPASLTPKARRQKALRKELDRYNDHEVRFDASGLPEKEKKLLSHLLRAAALVEALNKLQIHPKNLEWAAQVRARGTKLDRRLYRRNQMVWCVADEGPDCNALAKRPPKAVGLLHWPKNMTDAEFKTITGSKNKALVSPFTVVRRTANGGFKAVPYSADPLLGPRMKKVAAELKAAAKFAPHPSLRKFLLSRAAAFEAKTPFPYDKSDSLWIALKGKWEVTVGPYEVYKNPRQVKARFQMVIGIEAPAVTRELTTYRKRLQEMENQVARLVGRKIYKPRKLDTRIAIRAVNVVMAAGDARSHAGATVAYHLPNRGKSVDEGLYKKVMLVNHAGAFKKIIYGRAREVLDPGLMKYLSPQADILNTTFHEFAHGFGAHDELKVLTPSGTTKTVREALGPYNSLLEEEKADVLSLYLLAFMKRKKLIDDEHLKKRYVSALMHLFGLLNYPLKGTYPRMVAVQLGWYLDHGAVTYNAGTGRFSMNFAKWPKAVESLARKVAVIQLTGDRKAAAALVGRYIETIPPSRGKRRPTYRLKPPLTAAVTNMKEKFKKAGIKSAVLNYTVTGL